MRNTVAERRASLGLTQQALADALHVSRQTINAIERGKFMPSLPLAFGLALYFEVHLEDLFEVRDKG